MSHMTLGFLGTKKLDTLALDLRHAQYRPTVYQKFFWGNRHISKQLLLRPNQARQLY
jgi:hypothetical protein